MNWIERAIANQRALKKQKSEPETKLTSLTGDSQCGSNVCPGSAVSSISEVEDEFADLRRYAEVKLGLDPDGWEAD